MEFRMSRCLRFAACLLLWIGDAHGGTQKDAQDPRLPPKAVAQSNQGTPESVGDQDPASSSAPRKDTTGVNEPDVAALLEKLKSIQSRLDAALEETRLAKAELEEVLLQLSAISGTQSQQTEALGSQDESQEILSTLRARIEKTAKTPTIEEAIRELTSVEKELLLPKMQQAKESSKLLTLTRFRIAGSFNELARQSKSARRDREMREDARTKYLQIHRDGPDFSDPEFGSSSHASARYGQLTIDAYFYEVYSREERSARTKEAMSAAKELKDDRRRAVMIQITALRRTFQDATLPDGSRILGLAEAEVRRVGIQE